MTSKYQDVAISAMKYFEENVKRESATNREGHVRFLLTHLDLAKTSAANAGDPESAQLLGFLADAIRPWGIAHV
jgi:hypothetical protein